MPSLEFQTQPQETILTAAGQQALTEIVQAQATKKRLQLRLDRAVKRFTETAEQLNDRGTESRLRHEQMLQRLRENGEEAGDGEQSAHVAFQAKVDDLTQKMDQGVRDVIDIKMWIEEIPDVMAQIVAGTAAAARAANNHTQRAAPKNTRRTGQAAEVLEGDDDAGDTDHENGSEEQDPVLVQPDSSDAPSVLLRNKLSTKVKDWNSKTPTERYAEDNDYVSFYRTVFDAKNPGEDAPPVPHASLWFAQEEGRESSLLAATQGQHGVDSRDDEDSDLEIASERIRTKCPLTLMTFNEPWTSTKCPHSFEKDAILAIIRRSTRYLPWTGAQLAELGQLRDRRQKAKREKEIGTPCIGCPECAVVLTETDVKPNPALMRRVRRIVEAQRREQEAAEEEDDDDEEEGAPRGTQRKPVGLGSSPARRLSTRVDRVKNAQTRATMSRSQVSSGAQMRMTEGAPVIDIGDDENEDEEMEDE